MLLGVGQFTVEAALTEVQTALQELNGNTDPMSQSDMVSRQDRSACASLQAQEGICLTVSAICLQEFQDANAITKQIRHLLQQCAGHCRLCMVIDNVEDVFNSDGEAQVSMKLICLCAASECFIQHYV